LSSASSVRLNHIPEGTAGACGGVVARVAICTASVAIPLNGVEELAHGAFGLADTVANELAVHATKAVHGTGAVCAVSCAVLAASIFFNVSSTGAGSKAAAINAEQAIVALHAMSGSAAGIASRLAVHAFAILGHGLSGTGVLTCVVGEDPIGITCGASVCVCALGTMCCASCTSAIGCKGPVGARSYALTSTQGVSCAALGACISVGAGSAVGRTSCAGEPHNAGQDEKDDSPSRNHGLKV